MPGTPLQLAIATLVVGVPGLLSAALEPLLEITVQGRPNQSQPTPCQVDLPDALDLSRGVHLVELRGEIRQSVHSQLDPGPPARLHWILPPPAPGDTTRTFALLSGNTDREPTTRVSVHNDGETLCIMLGEALVLQYNHAPVPPPEGQPESYTRSGFIHPIWSPSGNVLTQIHPKDHIHHMGLWNPWAKTTFEGRHVDFWNLGAGQGTVRFAAFGALTSGPVFGGFAATHHHVDLKAPGGEKIAIEEQWDVRVWNTGIHGTLIDFTTTQRCGSDSPITLEAYRYGGFGFRARPSWIDGDYLTSEGKTRADGHGTRSRWCHTYGPTPSGKAGILFMSHPENREHPEPMRIWPKGHVFFNFCPIQKRPWTFEPGTDYTLRYRLFVYDGAPSVDLAEALWQDFAAPPTTRIGRP